MGTVVLIAGLVERVGAIVPGKVAGKTDQHLAERRMHVEEERPINVPAAHLAEMCLIPAHVVRHGDVVEARAKSQQQNHPKEQPPPASVDRYQ